MGRKQDIEEEEEEDQIQVENQNQKTKKIKREKLIQKQSKIDVEKPENEMKKKRIRARKVKDEKLKEIKEKALNEIKDPQGFNNFMNKLKKQNEQNGQLASQKKKLKVKKIITKEDERKQRIQNKLQFKKHMETIQTGIGLQEKNTLEEALEFKGFDDEFGKMKKQAELQKQKEEYEQAKGTSNKQKNKIQNTEINKMKQVLGYKPFQSNPLAALKQHITNQQQQKSI